MSSLKNQGFTLIELMVVVAIVALLSALAAPSFKQMIQSNTISAAVNGLLSDMRFARSEAIRRGGGVVICHSAAPQASSPTCNAGADWKTGWIIFHDLNNDGIKDNTDPVLKAQDPLTAIDSVAEVNTSTGKFVFAATGRTTGLTAATGIRFGGSNFVTDRQRVVCIGISGRSQIGVDANGKTNGSATC